MTRDEHKEIIQKMMGLVTPENQATATELLTSLSEDYEQTLTASETLTANNEKLTANNEKLRQVNADLFLKVGTSTKDNNKEKENENNGNDDETPSLTYESLFNEKGELI